MALAWILAQHPSIVPIPGTTKLHRLRENTAAAASNSAQADLAEITAAADKIDLTGDRYPAAMQRGSTADPAGHPTSDHAGRRTAWHRTLEQDIIALSRQKWQWMSRRQIEPLAALFHEDAVFVHMGATMTKDEELEVIDSGQIHYKDIDIQETSVRFIGAHRHRAEHDPAGGRRRRQRGDQPFVVTEVYVRDGEAWKLASLSFTRLLTH